MFLFLVSPLLHQVFAAPGGLPNFSNGLGDGPYELFGLDFGWTSWLQLQYFKVPASSDSSYDPSVPETSTQVASPSVTGTYTSTPLSWTSPANGPGVPGTSSQAGSPSITEFYTSTTPSWTFPSNDSTVSDTSSQIDDPSMSGTYTSTIFSWTASPTSPSSAPPSTSTATADLPVDSGGLNTSAVVDQHNLPRQNSTDAVSLLSWSTDLANTAADIAASCVYGHNTYVLPTSWRSKADSAIGRPLVVATVNTLLPVLRRARTASPRSSPTVGTTLKSGGTRSHTGTTTQT